MKDPDLSPEPHGILLGGGFASGLLSGGCGGGGGGSGDGGDGCGGGDDRSVGGADAFFFKAADATFNGHPTGVFTPDP